MGSSFGSSDHRDAAAARDAALLSQPARARTAHSAAGSACLVALLVLAACSGSEPPRVAPEPPVPIAKEDPLVVKIAPPPSLTEIETEAELRFARGRAAIGEGRDYDAELHFDAAIEAYTEADLPPEGEQAFEASLERMIRRIERQQPERLPDLPEAPATELENEAVPTLTEDEIKLLRSRLEDSMPDLPRFSIPVPLDNDSVLEAIEFLTTQRHEVIQEGINRAQRYLPHIRDTFEEAGVPLELAWIPLIESFFKPTVRSRAAAVGMWQLMAPTARLYGLRVDWYVDERRDPVKATTAIAKFILDYYDEFQDWHLMIAAYNGGKGRVARAMQRAGVDDFWSLAQTTYLPRETREFVPKVLAAIIIGSDPERYGFTVEQQQPTLEFDQVVIDSMADLQVIADAAGSDVGTIADLNLQLLRRTTPNVKAYTVRVPRGTAGRFEAAFAAIPRNERVLFVEHSVGRGETLSGIADKYDTSLTAIAEMNNIRNRHRIAIGQRLLIPVGQPGARATVASRSVAQGSNHAAGDSIVHVVRRGETLGQIASSYSTRVSDVKRWNNLSSHIIYPGNRLQIEYGGRGTTPASASASVATAPDQPSAAAAPQAEPVSYTVQSGDTLGSIAQVHRVRIASIREWNSLRSDIIHPGDKLTIHSSAGGAAVTTTYTIRRGDTLTSIAARFGATINDLCAWNGIGPRTVLYPGNRLVIRERARTAGTDL